MNREIKFEIKLRAKEPVNGYNKGDCVTIVNDVFDIQNGIAFFPIDKKFEIVYKRQFTGLLDKNGKEIYEGDILCNDEYQNWEWRGVVKFSHGVFGSEWLANIKNQSMVGIWGQKHNLRKLDDDILERQIIIGNIYENPELL